MNQNPYAPPGDDLPPPPAGGDDGFIEGGRGVEAGRGYQWLVGGWELVKGRVGMWILLFIAYAVIAVVLSIIPVVGQFLLQLVAPVLSAGLYLGCRDVRAGRELGVGHIFAGFERAGGLLLLGLVSVVWSVAMQGVGIAMGAIRALGESPKFTGTSLDMTQIQKLLLYSAVVSIISIPLTMARYYAPALVAIQGLSPVAALKNSFLGAAKNVLPFIVYSLAAMMFAFLAILPCGLGFVVYFPVLIASVYVGYRDVFFVDAPPSEA